MARWHRHVLVAEGEAVERDDQGEHGERDVDGAGQGQIDLDTNIVQGQHASQTEIEREAMA